MADGHAPFLCEQKFDFIKNGSVFYGSACYSELKPLKPTPAFDFSQDFISKLLVQGF